MTIYKIVGAHYRPPAKALIKSLPQSFPLYITSEPENLYDRNAIRIYLKSSDIKPQQYEIFNEELQSSGKEIDDILQQENWHLGYIPKEHAKILKDENIIENGKEYQVHFSVSYSGEPTIEL